jgi:MOSC domain-containing protein YiiM
MAVIHASHVELAAGLAAVAASPREEGTLEMIVRRPARGERQVVTRAELDADEGLVGDRWARGKRRRANQLTLMNARLAAIVAGSMERWSLAGDQLYVDLDLSEEHLPPGTRVVVGSAVIQISAEPHTGCRLFEERFGRAALEFVNSSEGRRLNLRGVNAWVTTPGTVRVGDTVRALFE